MLVTGETVDALAYPSQHERVLRGVFTRLALWPDDVALPAPTEIATGVAGFSVVYFVFLPKKSGGGRYVVAKFDDPSRSEIEWDALDDLRRLSNPPEILRPIEGNRREDGVLIFDAAEGLVGHLKCMTLLPLLRQQIGTNPQNCIRAIEKTFNLLSNYYHIEPGKSEVFDEGKVILWSSIFPNFQKESIVSRAIATAERFFPEIEWRRDRQIKLPFAQRNLPNPFLSPLNMLGERTGPIQLSRIHGDLNLTNIVAALEANKQLDRVFIIDLTNCRPGRALALDFSRLELEIWRNVISKLPVSEEHLLDYCLLARDFLDGRIEKITKTLPDHVRGGIEITDSIRREARQFLRVDRRDRTPYALEDYFRCMYFSNIRALSYSDVRDSSISAKVLTLCAALTLEYLMELNAGHYAEGALRKRWLPPRKRDTDRDQPDKRANGADRRDILPADIIPTESKPPNSLEEASPYRSVDWRQQQKQLEPFLTGKSGGVIYVEVPDEQYGTAVAFAHMLKQLAQSDQRGVAFQISPENNWTRYPADIVAQMAKKFRISSIDGRRVLARATNTIPDPLDVAALVGEIGIRLGSWRYFLLLLHCHRIEKNTLLWLKEIWSKHLAALADRGLSIIFVHDPKMISDRSHVFPVPDLMLQIPTTYDGAALRDALDDITAIIYDRMSAPDIDIARVRAKAFLDTCEQNPRDVHDRLGAMLADMRP